MKNFSKMRQGLSCMVMALLLMLIPADIFAQNSISVSGIVMDDTNEPVIGAAVMVKGTTTGVITDIDGRYTISAPANGILSFSYVGLKDKEEKVNGRTTINIIMETDSKMIDEVVVIGYGTQRRGSVTGAVSAVKGQDMIKTKNENPQNMLTGRIPGLRVWQKSSEPGTFNNSFDVRGMGAPLIIIDGIPRSTEEFQRLNAMDIDDISVLKDASAAIYGVRAANGVVLVTTKKGGAGKTEFSYNGSYTFQQPSRMPELCDPYESMTLFNEMSMNNINGGSWVFSEESFEAFRNGTRRTTDWNDLIISNVAPQTQHDISISGGTEKTKFYISMGYFYQEGIFRSGDLNYNKFNLRSNISTEIAKGIKFELGVSGISDERNTPYTSSQDIIRNYWRQGVLYPAYADPEGTMLNYNGLDMEQNTVAMMTADISGYKKYKQKYFQSSATLTADFGEYTPVLKGLTAKAMFSYDYRADNNEAFRKEYYQYAYDEQTGTYKQKVYNESSPSNMRREFYDKSQMLGQFTVNYDRTFNDVHHVGGVIGWEVQKRNGDNFYAVRDLAFSMPYLLAGVTEGQIGAMQTGNNDLYEQANEALIGRINYSFADRYLLEAQFRYDGSSKFAKGHQWGYFPSVSAGWRFSEEKFIKSSSSDFLSNGKLRLSWGQTGNYNVGNGALDYYGADPWYGSQFGDSQHVGIYVSQLGNPNLTWETTTEFNIGLDLGFFNNRINLTAEYFQRTISDLLVKNKTIPHYNEVKTIAANIGSTQSNGVELTLNTQNIQTKQFTWSTDLTFSTYNDRWKERDPNWKPAAYQKEQDPIRGVFAYVADGLLQPGEEAPAHQPQLLPGQVKLKNINGDDKLNEEDMVLIGRNDPKFIFGFNNNFSYKNFDLNIYMYGQVGKIAGANSYYDAWGSYGNRIKLGQNVPVSFKDAWSSDNQTSTRPSFIESAYGTGDLFLQKISFLRIRNITLGYTVPISKSICNRLRVYADVNNPCVWTNWKGQDPETDSNTNAYPNVTSFSIGVDISF